MPAPRNYSGEMLDWYRTRHRPAPIVPPPDTCGKGEPSPQLAHRLFAAQARGRARPTSRVTSCPSLTAPRGERHPGGQARGCLTLTNRSPPSPPTLLGYGRVLTNVLRARCVAGAA
jgi:hypothetical protein